MNFSKIIMGAGLVAASLVPASVFACSCSMPGLNTFQIGLDGLIPENAGGITWNASFASEDPADDIWVEQVDGDTRTRVDFTVVSADENQYVIRPTSWAVNNIYRFHAETGEGDGNDSGYLYLEVGERIQEVEIQVGPALDASYVSQLSVSGLAPSALSLLAKGGSCSDEFQGVALDLWMNIPRVTSGGFNYTTLVDGEVWAPQTSLCTLVPPGESWVGRGRDRLVLACDSTLVEEAYRLESGSHTVTMEARLPGTDIVFTTETQTVELTCPEPTVVDECPTVEEASGGCQSTAGVSTWMPLLALIGLFGWRRRRIA